MAQKVASMLPPNAMLYRLDGDEFGILHLLGGDTKEAAHLFDKLQAELLQTAGIRRKEIESLRRREMISVSEESITEETPFFLPDVRIYEMKLSINLKESQAECCILRLCGTEDFYTESITADLKETENSGWGPERFR